MDLHSLALKILFLKVVTWVMNDPLKYETRHLLFEVGRSIYVTFYYFIVIMNR